MITFDEANNLPPHQAIFNEDGTLSVGSSKYSQSNIMWVFDFYGPTGRPSSVGLLRVAEQTDIDGLIQMNEPFNVKITKDGEIVLNHIQKPQ
jgi:hypothetical protein